MYVNIFTLYTQLLKGTRASVVKKRENYWTKLKKNKQRKNEWVDDILSAWGFQSIYFVKIRKNVFAPICKYIIPNTIYFFLH